MNLRPLGPKPSALAGLGDTLTWSLVAEGGIEPHATRLMRPVGAPALPATDNGQAGYAKQIGWPRLAWLGGKGSNLRFPSSGPGVLPVRRPPNSNPLSISRIGCRGGIRTLIVRINSPLDCQLSDPAAGFCQRLAGPSQTWLGEKDSNLHLWIQSPVACQLADPPAGSSPHQPEGGGIHFLV